MPKSRKNEDAAEKASFETLLRQTEDVITRLEQDDVPLEEGITLYEKGVESLQVCDKILKEAQLRVKKVARNGQHVQLADFEDSE